MREYDLPQMYLDMTNRELIREYRRSVSELNRIKYQQLIVVGWKMDQMKERLSWIESALAYRMKYQVSIRR
ncbi:MAG: hypothetical protein CEN89_320 [Candidatus Berkelbacteria bacterium Licking1014_7]|uniref:Uncharacterized protein n=1 Tax=Candidatus Berkelbacteria bacterium Licking1014_7 TaxID=2017147 RepID=A0A554LJP2_9BACT|nr:MAG: hypothetical protein CEN89_320 [Candidatus Berkelbacteria bacterium Licking1014_7]